MTASVVALAASVWVWGTRSIGANEFMPHGYCYLWNPLVLWLNLISDALITLSYYCIPVVLIYFARRNRELPFNRIFWMFGAFILACGTTHLLEVWNIWHASYLAAGVLKAVTALVSVITAAMLIPLVPKLISLPGRAQLEEINRGLEAEIAKRSRFDALIEDPFRRKVNLGFVVAVLATLTVGASAWWGARRAEHDEFWVAHTHEVMETVQRVTRHTIEAMTSARAFSLTGKEPLLAHYQIARDAIFKDVDDLHHLTADNNSQEQRIQLLEPRIHTALGFSTQIIAKRQQSQAYDGSADALETEKYIDSVRESTRDIYQEEKRLLAQREQTARSDQRLTRIIALAGALLGLGLWGLAKVVVNREIDISSRAQAQIKAVNAQLEERVAERTAELEANNRSLQKEIDGRAQAEYELRASQERLASILESAMDAIITADSEQRIVMFNAAAEKMFRCSAVDALGQPIDRLIPERFRALHGAHIRHFAATGTSSRTMGPTEGTSGALWGLRSDGREFPVEASISQVEISGKKLFTVILRDVTERKRADERLREQARVLDMAPVLVRDMNGFISLWSRGMEELYGYSAEEALGKVSHELFGTKFPVSQREMEAALQGVGRWEGELVHRRKDGGTVIVASVHAVYRDESGEIRHIMESNTDITARKHAEERLASQAEELSRQAEDLLRAQDALREKTRVLRLVMDNMGEGLVAADQHGKFLLWNESSTRLLQRGPTDLPPEQWSDYFGVFDADGVTRVPPEKLPLARALAGEEVSSELLIRPVSGGETWIEVVARPLRGEDGALQGGVAVLRDTTQRKKAEQEKEKYVEELKRSNAELEQFAYVASHDLQEPLRMVASYTEILGERYKGKLDANADKYIGYAVSGAQRMQRLIRDLLAYARVSSQAKPLQPTDVGAVLATVLIGMRGTIDSNKAEIVSDKLPTVMADEVQLGQVLQNLINNAIKFHSERRPRVEIRTRANGNSWHFTVQDNGIGMDMESAGRIFQMFQRLHTRDEYEGTGIGLAIAKRIVERHGGRIWCESTPGQGSTFHFTLPKGK